MKGIFFLLFCLFFVHCGVIEDAYDRTKKFITQDDERATNKPDASEVTPPARSQEGKNKLKEDIEQLGEKIAENIKDWFNIFDNEGKKCKVRRSRTQAGFILDSFGTRSPHDKALDCLQEKIEDISTRLCTARDEIEQDLAKAESKNSPNVQEIERLQVELEEFIELEEDFRQSLRDTEEETVNAKDDAGGITEEILKSTQRVLSSESNNYCSN